MKNTEESFAEKLNRLIEKTRKPDGGTYTQAEIVQSTKGILTRVYLWKLRKGKASNPGLKVIQALAQFFGVAPDYFFEGDNMKRKPSKDNGRQDGLVEQIALRSSELDGSEKQAVLFMIESIAKSKGKK